jgi:hypothetical protein
MSEIYIKDLIQLPEQVNRGDFVLRLSEGITDPEATVGQYVVTPQLEKCFDEALTLIKSAVEGNSSKAAYLHGSFGSGKSHFMAILHLMLQGNVVARSIPELAGVVTKHNGWMEGRKFLLVPYHLIGSKSLDGAILGGYVRHLSVTEPDAPTPAVYRSEKLLEDADNFRERLGDEKFFEQLNAGVGGEGASDGWGEVSSTWDEASYTRARNGSADATDHQTLVSDLIDSFFKAMKQTDEFVSLDDGLAILSAHAKSLGYDAVIFFLDELILWLASHAANLDFVATEAQKVPKLVESERGDRPVPIVSFVARQRDLRELVGDHIPGSERLSFSDVLSYWEGRFGLITLEDRNLPLIAEKRILRPINDEARAAMDQEFARTSATREEVMKVLLTSTGNRDDFRKLYPFSPALVETLVAVSSLLQRERTALKIMVQLLVQQRDSLKLGQIVPLGDLYDQIAQGDEAFSAEMKTHFENANKLYFQHLRPLLEKDHGLTFDQAESLPHDDPKRRGLTNDDRLVKTLLLGALAPEVESLKNMTPTRLAALNHGTIKAPIAGQEATTVLNKCRHWQASIGQIKIQESAGAQPTIKLQLSGVDVQRIIEQAESIDNHGNRIRKLKDMLFEAFGIANQQELFARKSIRWRGTDRECELLVSNVREVADENLESGGSVWRIIIDYPFDQGGHRVQDDLERINLFRDAGKTANTICWLPSFLNHKAMEQLGRLVRLEHILNENRFQSFVNHLSDVDRAAARAQMENQRDSLAGQLRAQFEMAYGLRGGGADFVDSSNLLEGSDHFHALDGATALQPPAASSFREGLEGLLDQALRGQFPAHPMFAEDALLTKNALLKIFDVAQEAIRSSDPSTLVSDAMTRKHMLRVAVPLKLGEMGENRFQIGQHWKTHFERLIHQHGGGQPVSVRRLREWIDQPNTMGLPELLQDLVILIFAEQTNRSFSLHGNTVLVELGGLNNEMIVQETPLPDQAPWEIARVHARSIFGVDSSPLRNAANVAQLAADVRREMDQNHTAVAGLPERLKEAGEALGMNLEGCDRWQAAEDVKSLIATLESAADERALTTRLGEAELKVPEAALGASLKQSRAITDLLGLNEWRLFIAAVAFEDERKVVGQEIWSELEIALMSSEHAIGLSQRFKELRNRVLDLLAPKQATGAKPVLPLSPVAGGGQAAGGSAPLSGAAAPQATGSSTGWAGSDFDEVLRIYGADKEKIERNRKLVRELKNLYRTSQIEGDTLPAWIKGDVLEELLEVHHIMRLADGGLDERMNMIVLTPTLHALVHLDPNASIDLIKGTLELPKFGIQAKVIVKPDHNG